MRWLLSSERHSITVPLCAVAVVLLCVAGLQPHLPNHDVAQFMYGGRAMLGGATLYRDFIEMNLPTVYYASAMPMLLAERLGLSPNTGLLLCVFAVVALSLAVSARLLRRAGLAGNGGLLLLVLAVEVLPVFRHFGQREHLFAVLALPYVLSFLEPAEGEGGGWAVWAAGVLAGLGLSLKVYFFVLPLFVEAAAGWTWRGRRQSWVAAFVGGGCLAVALWRHPEYVHDLVPLARATYGGWEVPPLQILRNEGLASSVLALWLAGRLPPDPRHGRVRLLLSAAAAAGLAVAVMQNKGYDYHFLPAIVPSLLLLSVVLADALAAMRRGDTGVQFGAVLVAALLLAWDGGRAVRDMVHPFNYNETSAEMAKDVARWGGGRPLVGLSVHVFPTFPYLLRHGGQWGLRYPSLWPLAGYLKAGGRGPVGERLAEVRHSVAEDMATAAPCLVFVDTLHWWNADFDLLGFLSQDPQFAAQWRQYRPVGRVDGYDLYARCPAAGSESAGVSRAFP